METYKVIEISNGDVMLSNSTYDECVEWIDNYGNIIDYTIVPY
jgi:phosphosulfolactate synthase (CoM biosynthesis protein A)